MCEVVRAVCDGVSRCTGDLTLDIQETLGKYSEGVTDRSEVDRSVECGCLESREGAEGWLYRGSEIKFG